MKKFIVLTVMDNGKAFPGYRLNVDHIIDYSPYPEGTISKARTHLSITEGGITVAETVEQIDALIGELS